MNCVNLSEVDLAVQEHAQIFMTWRAHHNARHRATVFAEDPQRFRFWIFRHELGRLHKFITPPRILIQQAAETITALGTTTRRARIYGHGLTANSRPTAVVAEVCD